MARARLWSDRNGAAAAEMALVLPLLLVLLFGSFEMGKYFLDAHTVQKAVRDGSRFAGRQPFSEMPCGGPAADETQIRNLVRTGNVNGGNPRISYWTNPATITVTVACDSGGTYSNAGIYTAVGGGARRVTVSASIPYTSLFGLSFGGTQVNAQSQAAVMGI